MEINNVVITLITLIKLFHYYRSVSIWVGIEGAKIEGTKNIAPSLQG